MGLRGLSRLIGSLCFKSGLSTTIRVSLIVAPDRLDRIMSYKLCFVLGI